MSVVAIDSDELNIGDGRNPFEELGAKFEMLKLQGYFQNEEEADRAEKTILLMERKYQDFCDVDKDKAQIVYKVANATNLIFEKESDIKLAFEKLNSTIYNLNDWTQNISVFYDKMKLDNSRLGIFSFTKQENKKYTTDEVAKYLNKLLDLSRVKTDEVWEVKINFDTNEKNHHKPLDFIYTLIEGVNTIEGVEAWMEDIKIGSLWTWIKVSFNNLKGKQEFKDTIDGARKIIKGKTEKDFNESEKLKAESEKIKVEKKAIEKQLENQDSEAAKTTNQINLESAKIELELKRLQLEERKIEVFKNKRNLLKEMIAEGIHDQKQLEILLNDLPFLTYENGNVIVGEDIDVIDKKND